MRPDGWREAAGAYGEDDVQRSVADVTGPEPLKKVRAHLQQERRAARAARIGRTRPSTAGPAGTSLTAVPPHTAGDPRTRSSIRAAPAGTAASMSARVGFSSAAGHR
ncbi:hypothetical protein ACFVHB_34770 [Kitasatospora sp. NPDC127111]|uniref:hypothetical protein n=1 Tax=Kitasatospora sp. NPDC127111 TaxID=3345363 RepID=UPI003635B816